MPLNSLIELVESTTIRAGPVLGMEVVLVIGTAAKVIRKHVLPLAVEAAETYWRVRIQWVYGKVEYLRVVRRYANVTEEHSESGSSVLKRPESTSQRLGPYSEPSANRDPRKTSGSPGRGSPDKSSRTL